MGRIRKQPVVRLGEKIQRRDPDDCWLWKGSTTPEGYGKLSVDGKTCYAHRLSYEIDKGPPGKLCVLHTCDNPPCCNPAHLFLGTQQENVEDRQEKKRQSRGEQQRSAKLTEEQVEEVRRDCVLGSRTHGQRAFARKYGVHPTTIWAIVNGETWKSGNSPR